MNGAKIHVQRKTLTLNGFLETHVGISGTEYLELAFHRIHRLFTQSSRGEDEKANTVFKEPRDLTLVIRGDVQDIITQRSDEVLNRIVVHLQKIEHTLC